MISKIRHALTRVVEAGLLPADDANLRLKKVALTLVPLIIGPAALVWGMIYFLLGHPISGSIPIAYSIISAASLGFFFRTKRTEFLQYSQLLLVLLLPFLLMWSLGGFAASSMVIIWAIFSPIAALMFLEKRVALLWFLAYFVLILISTLIDGLLSERVAALPEWARNIFYFLNFGCGSAGLYLLVSYSIGEEKRAIESLNDKQHRLEERSRELFSINRALVEGIAEREQVQLELKGAKEHAEKLNRMLHMVLDTIPVRLFWKDRNLIYLGCNRLFAQDAGKSSPQEVIGASDYDMGWHETADLYRSDDTFIMETARPKLNFEEPQSHPDGSTTWLRTSKVPLRDAAGEVFGVLGTYEDITEQKQTAEALVVARDDAEAASRAKSEFLASMSHELRTPLNAILGFSQLLGMSPQLPEATKKQALEIEHAGQHLLSLVNDLIDLARIESGKLELSLEAVPLLPILKDSLTMVAPLACKQGIELGETHCHCGLAQVTIRADYVRLRQVVINLLSNAIKYNRPQGSVYISCQKKGDWVRIQIADTGPGIPAEKQARIFNAFDRLGAERGSIEGTGIGLVITRRIVEAMGGRIGFESREGQGSTFWVEFPLSEIAVHPEPQNAVVDQAPDQPLLQVARPVVLYIEDNPMNLRLMRQIFAFRQDLELRDAHNAEIGIELARAEPPALILMDINLPGMDGYQALAQLKADPKTAHIPVIAVSANAMKGDAEHGREAGFATYFTKPLDVASFMSTLTRLLEGKADN